MGVLLLVRHGQASLGTADYDRLSDVGRRQAQVTGARLARTDLAVDRVVSGALTRQRDTAEAVLAALGWPAAEAAAWVLLTGGILCLAAAAAAGSAPFISASGAVLALGALAFAASLGRALLHLVSRTSAQAIRAEVSVR